MHSGQGVVNRLDVIVGNEMLGIVIGPIIYKTASVYGRFRSEGSVAKTNSSCGVFFSL